MSAHKLPVDKTLTADSGKEGPQLHHILEGNLGDIAQCSVSNQRHGRSPHRVLGKGRCAEASQRCTRCITRTGCMKIRSPSSSTLESIVITLHLSVRLIQTPLRSLSRTCHVHKRPFVDGVKQQLVMPAIEVLLGLKARMRSQFRCACAMSFWLEMDDADDWVNPSKFPRDIKLVQDQHLRRIGLSTDDQSNDFTRAAHLRRHMEMVHAIDFGGGKWRRTQNVMPWRDRPRPHPKCGITLLQDLEEFCNHAEAVYEVRHGKLAER